MRFLFQFITWAFMPILMPIYGLLIVMFSYSEPIEIGLNNSLYYFPLRNKVIILIYFLIVTVIIPGLIYIIMQKTDKIKTIQMDDRSERKVPLVIMSICCLCLLYIFTSIDYLLPKYIYALCLSGAVIISLFTLINEHIKISLHATGVGIFTGFLIAYFSEQTNFSIGAITIGFLISGLVFSSRLFLEKHTIKELVLGYVLSLLITFVLTIYYPLLGIN